MDIRVTIDGLDGLDKALQAAPAMVVKELCDTMERAVLVTEAEVVDRTPTNKNRTGGALRNSIATDVRVEPSGVVGVVGTSSPYALFVEEDTRPHIIAARNGRALAFHPVAGYRLVYQGSQAMRGRALYTNQRGSNVGKTVQTPGANTVVFAQHVHHPGTKGQHMFLDGWAAARPRVLDLFGNMMERIAGKLGFR